MRNGKYVIIHVDDSPSAREIVNEALTYAGYIVFSAENASDMELLLKDEPKLREDVDLVVLDMEMPDMTGAQLGAVMQDVYHELTKIPFVIYSGREEEWVEQMIEEVAGMSEAFRRNYRGYLNKGPGSEDTLVLRIKIIVEYKG